MPLPPQLKQALNRIERVAKGGVINIVYQLPVGESLTAFRADLTLLVETIRDDQVHPDPA